MNIIPKDWEYVKLGDLLVEKPKSLLKVSDAKGFGQYPFFTSGEDILLHNEGLIDGENIFLATGGIANIKYFKGKVAYSTDTYTITTYDRVKTKYLYYLLLNKISYINDNFFLGSGLKHLQKKHFKNFSVLLPKSLHEQQKIAEILSTVDKAIDQTEQLIAKYQRIKTGLMHDLLTKGIDKNGKIRSEKTHKFKDSPLGRIPEEWEYKTIDKIAFVTKLSGFEFTKFFKYINDGEIIALRALNIKNGKIILNDIRRISKNTSDLLIRSKLNKNDIIITYIGAYIGAVAQIKESNKYHLAPNIAKIVVKDSLISDFLEYALKSHYLKKQIRSLTTTTANPSLTMGQIRTMFVTFPIDKQEQEKIVNTILSIIKKIENLQAQLNKLRKIKTGLMQDLLSGKKRVTNLLKKEVL